MYTAYNKEGNNIKNRFNKKRKGEEEEIIIGGRILT